ncbi:MAG: bifunctional transcriptional activator/DNA repair enzyme AdaA [Phycisphaerales bacterium]
MISTNRTAPTLERDLPPVTEMYRAVVERDSSYDGVFVLGVQTTGIFCRPGCGAKTPNARNVEYFVDGAAALSAGYRPCKRCRPMDTNRSRPVWVTRLLDRVESSPTSRLTDSDLRTMGIAPSRARVWFKRNFGMTFHAYARARRVGQALGPLRKGANPLQVGRHVGFESDSGFRDAFVRLFGATPSASATVSALLARRIETPLGPMLAIAGDAGLALLEFVDRRMFETQIERIRRRFGGAVISPGEHAALDSIERELDAYFAGDLSRFETRIDFRGAPFQEEVWRALLDIPYGETRSYADMARAIGRPGAARAVGRANGDNRLAIVIPCHRVVRADGSLCGYGGGLWRKKRLLELERAIA